MKKIMSGLKFYFRNGETWTIDRENIGDLWIKQVTTSYGRIDEGELQEIHPCQSFKIEITREADQVKSNDINLGGLETGMFDRVARRQDIERMEILYRDLAERDSIYFPYEASDTDEHVNAYQSSFVSDNDKLYLVIDPETTAEEVYPDASSN
ncbi:hypothetical protein [Lacticigenium naphthae]|uniref:hypothetical protein n=1 Tax=Lacticigenium naphthae TaxID=515351 RepID=UPI0003FB67EC|nr:hypothetical protein [Lacticigenium naphthae]